MKKLFKSLACAAALVLFTASAFANDYVKFKGWKQAETTHFRFIYEAASEPAAKKYAEFADEAWEKIARIYSMPQEKTDVYVFSRMNIVNAYTMFSPPEIVMFDSPIIYNHFGFRDDWMKLFFTHELIHIANITFEDKDYILTKVFGESFRGMDYSSIPGWALEGLTTVLETELTNGGRGRSPYFELEFKAPTLDNALIPYRLIGTEQEPPSGQIYIMGYLIMRSIADRNGIQALADIERNRTDGRSWEESVKLVTGKTPQDIYREVKIALEKKYADERKIPEGKIISPNAMNTYYGNPSIIFDDGSMIVIKQSPGSTAAAILLDPSQKDGSRYYDQKDFVPKETILFKANFPDARALTADENKNLYFSAAATRNDRNPGTENQFNLYKWNESDGITQLTKDTSSYYQPVVSRNGKVLVAVEQSGLKMRIVQIDLESGEKSVVLEDERYSFIQPALNEDGSQLAFMLLKDDRACIALADMSTKEYKIVNNTDHDFITDPSSPSFNKDGTLNFCSNDRGRLEIFEAIPNSDGTTFTYTPALSDPIAALWAYKNDMAVFYVSQASTGDVIKIKPLEEWKNVPNFEGPSPAGEIMTLHELEDDYPDFDPYKEIAEQRKKAEKEKDETVDTELAETDTADATNSPAAASDEQAEDSEPQEEFPKNPFQKNKDKDSVKHRSDEALAKLENLEEPVKELNNEKIFLGKLSPLFYSPLINVVSDKENAYLGFGGFFVGQTARLQMNNGIIFFDAFYYPTLKNFTGEFVAEFPIGTGFLDLFISRDSSLIDFTDTANDSKLFSMHNIALTGYTLPIYSRSDMKSTKSLSYLLFAGGVFNQQDKEAFALTADLPFTKDLYFHTGLDYSQFLWLKHDNNVEFSLVNLLLGSFNLDTNKFFAGYEGEFSVKASNKTTTHELSTVIRYTDFPSDSVPYLSRAHFSGIKENCNFPGKILLNYTYIMPGFLGGFMDANFGVQGLASFGKNSDGTTPQTDNPLNFKMEKKLAMNLEMGLPLSVGQKISTGVSMLLDLDDVHDTEPVFNFYLSCKLNWLRL